MSPHRPIGVDVAFMDTALDRARPQFEALAALGYDECWCPETDNEDAFATLAAVAGWLPATHIGTAVVPIYTRGPALLAMSAATLASAAPGRFTLGIGTSSETIVSGWNDLPFVEPYKRMRDTLRFLRDALRGARIDRDYETFGVHGFRLGRVPDPPPSVVIGALRPQMLELGSAEADGVMVTMVGADDIRRIAPHVSPGKHLIAKMFVCPTTRRELFDERARRFAAAYLNVPAYAEFHRWLGRAPALEPVWAAWARGDRRLAAELIPDEVIDDLYVNGTPAACWEHIDRYLRNGATKVALTLAPFGTEFAEVARLMAPNDVCGA